MNITEVRIRLKTKEESKIRAIASITLDECFVVHDIKVIEGNEGFFIAMPSRKTPEGEFKDIVHPLNTETREFIKKRILEEYEKARAEHQQQQQQ
ncbi:MAG TPA: septation regulator SpoVG [Clostridia bacterium]